MNDTKPGWQTTEMWLTLVMQAISLLVALGVVSTADQTTLEGALKTAISSAFALAASAAVVVQYIRSRTTLKQNGSNGGTATPLLVFLVFAGLLTGNPVQAQQRIVPALGVQTQPTCLLPWRDGVERKLDQLLQQGRQQQPQTDLNLLRALDQLGNQNQQIIGLLQRQQAPPPSSAPAPVPIAQGPPQTIHYHYYQPGPIASAPTPGNPRIDLGQPGQPRIDLGQPGSPRIDLGQPGQPRIDLGHPQGPRIEFGPPSTPRIDLGQPGQPRIDLSPTPIGPGPYPVPAPVAPAPPSGSAPILTPPGNAKPGPTPMPRADELPSGPGAPRLDLKPPSGGGTVNYQRFTTVRALAAPVR